jgi:hypothetical protein
MPLSTFQACGAENYNHLKRKDLRNACMSKSQVFVCYSGSYFVARHNADLNLRVTESECVIRLWAIGLQSAYILNTAISTIHTATFRLVGVPQLAHQSITERLQEG